MGDLAGVRKGPLEAVAARVRMAAASVGCGDGTPSHGGWRSVQKWYQ